MEISMGGKDLYITRSLVPGGGYAYFSSVLQGVAEAETVGMPVKCGRAARPWCVS